MARKAKVEEVTEETEVMEETEETEASPTPPADTDFILEDEYKPEPLMPSGNYRGNVIGVVFDVEKNAIAWKIALVDNGGVMSDGETEIDGSHHILRNWLPKAGDDEVFTADGKSTKRQSKINMLKRFADSMKINMNTPTAIMEAITQQDWVGISVMATISINEYMGIARNQVDRMSIMED